MREMHAVGSGSRSHQLATRVRLWDHRYLKAASLSSVSDRWGAARSDAVVPCWCCCLLHWQWHRGSAKVHECSKWRWRRLATQTDTIAACCDGHQCWGAIHALVCVCVGETDHSLCFQQFMRHKTALCRFYVLLDSTSLTMDHIHTRKKRSNY
jgi:hypothetical protein